MLINFIQYSLVVTVPGCGSGSVNWKKLCGNPTMPRDGFRIDLEIHNINQTIVRNGVLVNAEYFDKDIDNFAFRVPENLNQTKFYVSMDYKDLNNHTEAKSDAIANAINELIKLDPETKISKPKVDSDESILTAILGGDFMNGGTVIENPKVL